MCACSVIMRQISSFGFLRTLLYVKRQFSSTSRLCDEVSKMSNQPLEEISIPSPWGSISGKWWGAANVQPILAVHGWEDNAGSFDMLAPLLVSDKTSVLAIDLPGHGLSSHIPLGTAYNFMDGVTCIRKIVKHYNWDKITIIGHSYGSKLAFTYAAFFPKDVSNLIGIECVRTVITQKEDDVVQGLRTAIESTLHLENRIYENKPPAYSMVEIIELMQKGSRGPVSKKCCEVILNRGAREAQVKGKYCFSRDPRLKAPPLGRLTEDMLFVCASRISCNVLQIIAKPGWGVGLSKAHKKTVEMLEKGANKFEQHILEGSHHIHLDSPEKVAPIVKKFVA